jgi:hypothetical protein
LSTPPRLASLVATLLVAASATAAGELDIDGLVAGRLVAVRSQPAWLAGGFGRFPEGAGEAFDTNLLARAHVHLGLDWRPSAVWTCTCTRRAGWRERTTAAAMPASWRRSPCSGRS